MDQCVVLDKSYLQGVAGHELRTLAESKGLLMTAALFYELMTTSAEERRKCFLKLPRIDNPVLLVEHIGVLLKYEVETGSPAGRPSSHCLQFSFRFNPGLVTECYSLPDEALDVLREQSIDVEGDVQRLISYSETVDQLFPGLLRGNDGEMCEARHSAYARICDLGWIQQFYESIRQDTDVHPCPKIGSTPYEWAHIRWLQVNLLFAVDLHIRHKGKLRCSLTPGLHTRLEHDVHDAQLLAFGVLEGELATREKKLRQWHLLLRSRGAGGGGYTV